MAEVIVRQQGCVANRVAYPRAVAAFHPALQMLSERGPSPAGQPQGAEHDAEVADQVIDQEEHEAEDAGSEQEEPQANEPGAESPEAR